LGSDVEISRQMLCPYNPATKQAGIAVDRPLMLVAKRAIAPRFSQTTTVGATPPPSKTIAISPNCHYSMVNHQRYSHNL